LERLNFLSKCIKNNNRKREYLLAERKFGKKNIIKVDPLAYNIGLIGESGIGKTTLAKEVCEKLVGEDGYMIFNCGKEDGIDAIAGAVYEDIPDWDTFEEVTDDILENKLTDYKDLKVIIYDTLDELFEIAEPEIIRLHNKENPEKPVTSIKAAFGGYMAGEDKTAEIILTRMWELKKIGVSMFIIGHTKKRTMTDVSTGLEYDMLTTNMSHRYFNALKTKLHVLGVASINRQITQTKTGKKVGKGKDRKDEIKGSIENETRMITFRDDNFNIDSKSRFSEIVDSIILSPDEFIKAVEDAIKVEHDKQFGNKSIEETKIEQAVEKEKIDIKNATDKKVEIEALEVEKFVTLITNFVKTNKTNPEKLKPLLTESKKMGYINPTKVDNLKDANILFDLIDGK
jgi:ABC-type oligopeptide transport system ATPase subunit